MKIAFFVTEFPVLSETFIINQIIGLQDQGHLVHIFSKSRPSTKTIHQAVINAGLLTRTFYFDKVPSTRFKKITRLLRRAPLNVFNKNLPALIKSIFKNNSKLSIYDFIPFLDKPEYDIVHAHFGINGNYVTQLRKLGLFKKAKFITTFHGYDLDEVFVKDNFYTDLFEDCNSFTVNSRYSKNQLIKLGCEEDKIKLLPVGLNVNRFKKKTTQLVCKAAGEVINIVFVGRLIEFKAPNLVIEIGKILKEKSATAFSIKIIGHGKMLPFLKNMIIDNELLSDISLLGPRTQEEIISVFEKSDIFLYPGITYQRRAENQGLVIQEAQAMRLPVIISDAGGMKEGIINEVTGFVVPENDINGFVKKIELLAGNPEKRKKMGAAGRKFVVENYDINKLNEKLIQIYLN